MLPKQISLKIKSFLKRFKTICSSLSPRYQLSYDDHYYDINKKDLKFRFKSFGDHCFPEFTFKEIKYNSSILYTINPHDLMKISIKNHIHEHIKIQLRISEILRNNFYKLSSEQGANVFSGEEICDNPILAEQIVKNDLFKIAYNTGFERGRNLSKLLNQENRKNKSADNIVSINHRM